MRFNSDKFLEILSKNETAIKIVKEAKEAAERNNINWEHIAEGVIKMAMRFSPEATDYFNNCI